MRAAGPALCALLLACAQGDNVTDLATLTDDQTEAVLAGEGAAAWTWASGLAVAAVCCCWAAVPVYCCIFVEVDYCLVFDGSFSPMGDYSPPSSQQEADVEQAIQDGDSGTPMSYLEGVVKKEVLFVTTLPFVFALTWLVPALAFRGKPPAWLQLALIIPLVWRTCRVEQRLTQKSVCTLVCKDITDCTEHLWNFLIAKLRLVQEYLWNQTPATTPASTPAWTPCPFLVSKLEVTDAVTDGLAIATVFVLERADWVFHARLEAAWGAGPIGRLFAPLVLRFGLSGLMLLVQIGAAVSQLGAGSLTNGPLASAPLQVGANLAGLGTLGLGDPRGDGNVDGKSFLFLVRKLLEGACQLLLQSSAILATGTGILGEPTLVASVMITSCLLLKEGVQQFNKPGYDDDWFNKFSGALMCCIVAGVALRLGMSETCGDSLLVDVGSFQCVPAPLPTRS